MKTTCKVFITCRSDIKQSFMNLIDDNISNPEFKEKFDKLCHSATEQNPITYDNILKIVNQIKK